MDRTTRIRDMAAGAAAMLAVVAILVGVPAALVTFVGWPLPSAVPTVDAVANAVRYGQIEPSTVLRSLAVVLWIIWATAALSIALETAAVARGTVARALPGLEALQIAAARLVATVMLLSSLAGRAAATDTSPPPVPPPPVELAGVPDGVVEHTAARRRSATPPTKFWTVQRRDSLWTIAEQSLGDGHRWKEIAALNHGRDQPDGGRLRPGDTLIRPGWRLALPADTSPDPRPAKIMVDGGDDLWHLADEHLDDGDRWPEIFRRNRGRRQPDGGRLTDPTLIQPGWVLRLPPERAADDASSGKQHANEARPQKREPTERDAQRKAAADAAEAEPPARSPEDQPDNAPSGPSKRRAPELPRPVTPATLRPKGRPTGSTPPVAARTTPVAAAVDHGPVAPTTAPTPIVIGGVALLAAGLVGVLSRRRRHWLQRRAVGAVFDPVEPEAAEFERWLRSMAEHDLHERLDRVLRVLTEHFAEHGVAPTICAVEFGPQVTLRLAEPDRATPPGMISNEDGSRWTLDPALEMAPPAADRYLPALVSCGRLAAGDLLLLNLLDAGVVGVVGTDDDTVDALTSWTAELAAGGASGGVEIVVMGEHHPLVERLARVTVVDDTRGAVERVHRVIDDGEGLAARVVVVGGAPPDAALAELVAAARDPRVGIVVAGAQPSGTNLEIAGSGVRMLPDGVWFAAPEWLSPQDWDRFGNLLRQPDRDYVPTPGPSPLLPVAGPGGEVPAVDVDVVTDLNEQVEIGLLGPLTIDGRPASIAVDAAPLLSYLAANPTGGDPATLAMLLWPADPDREARLERAIAATATALKDSLAVPTTVVTDDGRLELPAAVSTDLHAFRDLLRQLDQQPPTAQAPRMYRALDLVRGEPFSTGADWAHTDGTAIRTIGLIVDAAHRLAMHSLTVGDAERADWAVSAGLRAAPTCELLFRDRMRIADTRGDLAALDACLEELQTRVQVDGGWVTPETIALHEQLRARLVPPGSDDRRQDAS